MQRRKQNTNNKLWLRSKNWPIVCICADHEQRMVFKVLKGCKKKEKEKKKEKQKREEEEKEEEQVIVAKGEDDPEQQQCQRPNLALKTKNIY